MQDSYALFCFLDLVLNIKRNWRLIFVHGQVPNKTSSKWTALFIETSPVSMRCQRHGWGLTAAIGGEVLNISSTVDTCSPEQPFWSKKNEWLSYVSALIITLSFSDTERILEHPSHIWLLCHKSVKETSQPDHSHSGCHTPNTRDFECWDQSPFTSRAAPVIQWIPVWPL